MSWQFSFGPVSKAEVSDAVDAAEVTGQGGDIPGLADDITAARDALKALAARVKRPIVSGYANGHTLEPGQDESDVNWHDGFTVSVSGRLN